MILWPRVSQVVIKVSTRAKANSRFHRVGSPSPEDQGAAFRLSSRGWSAARLVLKYEMDSPKTCLWGKRKVER